MFGLSPTTLEDLITLQAIVEGFWSMRGGYGGHCILGQRAQGALRVAGVLRVSM